MSRQIPPSVLEALRASYAVGGRAAPFMAAPLPAVATPGLASPRGLLGAHHRQHFAAGGAALPPHVLAALALRPHFLDGGSAGEGGDSEGSSRSSGSNSSGGDNSGDGHGNSGDSSSSSSGSAGGVGGFGGSSSGDGYGGGSSSSSSSSGYGGGVGGFGGTSGSDGYGGGSSSGSNSNTSSGSAGGVGGFGGGSNDGYGGGSSGGTQSSGGFSSGAASGADSSGVGGSVGAGGVMGGGGLSGSSVGSSDVGSMGGSYGTPTAGGFSSSGDMSGGFGSFGSGPAANDTSGGFTGATPSASMMSGQTAGQSMSSEAASGGEAGEDGTGSMGGVSTAGAFGSFGSTGSTGLGTAGPYGGLDNARSAFGASPGAASDGTVGATPSSVAMSNPSAVAGLSPSGQAIGVMGMGGIDSGLAGMTAVGTTGALSGPGAYGLSGDKTPGFDNFNAAGNVTQSSLGEIGYTGRDNAEDQATAATQRGLDAPDAGYVGGGLGLSPGTPPSVAAAVAATTPAQAPDAYHGVDPAVIGGMFGDIGDIFGGITSPAQAAPSEVAASPYGTLSKTPMGPLTVGSLGQAMGTDRTSDTAGLNADGDPTAVNGTSALTIHGDLSPSAQAMSDGVPATSYGPGLAVPNATAGPFAQRMGAALALGQNAGVPSFSSLATTAETSPVPTSLSGATTFSGAPVGTISDQEAFNARQNIANGVGTDQDRATIAGYLGQQNGTQDADAGAAAPTTTAPALTVRGLPQGQVFSALHSIEGGVLNGQVDPNNPGHYGPAQFSQGTFSDTAAAHPELGIGTGMSMFNATPEQYAAITQAHWSDVGDALTAAGLPDTPGNRYLGWNLGVTGGIRALNAGPDASLTAAGISPSVQAANRSIYGGVSTVGQLQSKLDGKFAASATTMGSVPASVARAASPSFANFSPGAASGMDTTDTAAPGTNVGISPESTYSAPEAGQPTTQTVTAAAPYGVSPEVASALTVNGLAPTPANALAADTLGVANGIAVMNGPPGDPISSVDISPATVQANPQLFAGVRTIGDLQANITAAAPTAGTTTSTVTTPGAPAVAGALPGYSWSSGAASGLDSPDISAAQVGISDPSAYAAVPSAEATATTPSLTVDPGTGNDATSASAPDAQDHLSVSPRISNIAAGAALAGLGPIGAGIAAVNGISGLFGGPTVGDGINSVLAHPGAPTGVTGGGDNSNQPGAESWGSPSPSYSSGSSGASPPAGTSTPGGVNPLDPHATAIAAYQAALDGMGKGSGTTASTTDTTDAPRPPLIRGRPVRSAAATPLYRPMEDPIVRRALGLD